ncbi:unnamed protein product [Ectocarpus sp. CCAP 1310/34]|nr:unnamed protein product [Ectocarpus sp. CCAP 1310/34]
MATSSNPRTPLREPKRKRDTGLEISGLGPDDDDFCTPPGVTRRVANTTPLTPRSPNAATSSCGPKGKKPKKSRHEYKPVPSQYEMMTTARLFGDGHIARSNFSYNHPQFAKEADTFNGVTIAGKQVWQRQPSGPSTLHNKVTIIDHFSSLAPFLGPLEKLCKPRDSTDRLFLKQRAQQYITSGRRHRDGKNGLWRMCVTVHNPGAPPGFKRLELKADGTPDMECIDCPAGSYHTMDEVGTGTASHAHHQEIIDKNLLREHGAPTTFVLDFDPIDPNTFIDDVARIAEGTVDKVKAAVGVLEIIDKNLLREHGAPTTFVLDFDPIDPNTFIDDVARIAEGTVDKVKAAVGVLVYVRPRTEEQIGKSCASEKMRAYKQREGDDPDGCKKSRLG